MNKNKNKYLLIALIAHVVAAIFSIGVHHADELFQIYEFAGYKLGLNTAAELPWEFGEQMRSGWQPFIIFLFSKCCFAVGLYNPFIIAILVRLIQGLFSMYLSVKLLEIFEEKIEYGPLKKAFWFSGLLFWLLPYFQVRFSSESFGLDLLLIGFLLYFKMPLATWLRFLLIGFFFGTAFLVRFQLAFMVAGFGAWLLFVKREQLKPILWLLFGFVFALGFGLLIDFWLYDQWVLSWWKYLEQNLLHDKASQFGTQPFYFFITESFVQLAPPLSIILYAALFWFWIKRSKHWLTWITVPFILLHFPIAHKETRFLMPVLPFLPIMAVLFYEANVANTHTVWRFLRSHGFLKFSVFVNAVALIVVCLKPADPTTQSLNAIYDKVHGQKVVMYYDKNNPYEWGSLNYFRKRNLQIVPRDCDTSTLRYSALYFFKENAPQNDTAAVNGHVFERIYCNYPEWIYAFDFNGWVDRSGKYSIYKEKVLR